MHLYIPKASITGDHKLRGVLAAMGISDLFTNRANFSNLAKEAQLKVSEVSIWRTQLYFLPPNFTMKR